MLETNNQMRKGLMEFIVLLAISQGPVYASDIISILKDADLLVVEGTLYPLLSRLKNEGLVAYTWQESTGGPPRKYYTLAAKGAENLKESKKTWQKLNKSIDSLIKII
jgi:PadR family transcriptional regulator, regulatory protein PadR